MEDGVSQVRRSRLSVPLSLVALVALSSAMTLSTPARSAGPTVQECVAANEKWIPLKRAGKLREARANLLRCSVASCPAAVRDDCIAEATKLEHAIPTVVFVALDGAGSEITAVNVTMDGQPLADKLDGTALEVDPGEHLFAFRAASTPVVEKRLIIHEGEKNRRERIALRPPSSPVPSPVPLPVPSLTPPAPTPGEKPVAPSGGWSGQRTLALVVSGVGLAGIGVGGAFGVMAGISWNQAKVDCGPGCPPGSKAQEGASDARRNATISNIGFGAGGALLVAGVVLWLLAPSKSPSGSARVTPLVGPNMGGISASGSW